MNLKKYFLLAALCGIGLSVGAQVKVVEGDIVRAKRELSLSGQVVTSIQDTLSGSSTHLELPTAKAVVDYVLAGGAAAEGVTNDAGTLKFGGSFTTMRNISAPSGTGFSLTLSAGNVAYHTGAGYFLNSSGGSSTNVYPGSMDLGINNNLVFLGGSLSGNTFSTSARSDSRSFSFDASMQTTRSSGSIDGVLLSFKDTLTSESVHNDFFSIARQSRTPNAAASLYLSTSKQAPSGAITSAAQNLDNDRSIGNIYFQGLSPTTGQHSALIKAVTTQTHTNVANGGKIVLSTTPNGSIASTDRLTLDQNGDLIAHAYTSARGDTNTVYGIAVLDVSGGIRRKSSISADKISDFTESAQDVAGGVIVGGAGISVSYNDAGNSLTISNTGVLGSGATNYVTYWSGTSNVTGSANFVFNGTNASLGGVATPEQRLDVNGGIQTRFLSINPNTTNGFFYLGTANTILSGKSGSMVAPLTAYNAETNRSTRTLIIQGASDGLGEGISFVTGGTPAERLNISVSGAYTFNTLTGTGNRLPVLNASGVMTRSAYDPATFLAGNASANQVTYYTAAAALAGSANFVFNGTNASLGGVATPEQRLDVSGGIQTRFSSVNPNTTNGYLYLGAASTVLSGKDGSMIAPLTAYNAETNRGVRTLIIQGASNGLGEGISFVTGATSAERFNISVSGAYTFNTLTGTGNRLPVLNASGVMTRSVYDPATFLAGNGTANQVTYYTAAAALASSSNFVFNGTNVGIGGVASPEQRLDVSGGIQTRFASIDPNTTNGWVYLGPMNALLSSKSGIAIGNITAYNATLDKTVGELVLQGRSDAQASTQNNGITLVTGGNTGSPAPRYSINFSGQHRFHNLNGTGNRLPILDANGVMTRSSYDPALFLAGVTGSSSITVSGSAPSQTVAVATGGVGATELASTAVTAGTYGSATQAAVITIDADGRVTNASNATITQPTYSAGNGLILSGATFSVGGTLTAGITLTTADQLFLIEKGTGNTGTGTPFGVKVNNNYGDRTAITIYNSGGTGATLMGVTSEGQSFINHAGGAGYFNLGVGSTLFRFTDQSKIILPVASSHGSNSGEFYLYSDGLYLYDGFTNRKIAYYDRETKGSGITTHTGAGAIGGEVIFNIADATGGAFSLGLGTDMIEGVIYEVRCRGNGTNAITFNANNSCNFHISGDATSTRTTFTSGGGGTGFQAANTKYTFRRYSTTIMVGN